MNITKRLEMETRIGKIFGGEGIHICNFAEKAKGKEAFTIDIFLSNPGVTVLLDLKEVEENHFKITEVLEKFGSSALQINECNLVDKILIFHPEINSFGISGTLCLT